MKYSNYNYFLENYPQKGYITIYNFFTKKAVCYKEELLQQVPLSNSIKQKLINYGILVRDNEEEKERVRAFYKEKTQNEKKLKLMIALTGKCNCQCVYCYEKDYSPLPDTFQCMEEVKEFVKKEFLAKKIENFGIIYYGGEPLIEKRTITELSKYFHDVYKDKFYFFIITNGTLIDPETIRYWEQYGLRALKITIDGCEASNDKRRCYRSGKGTYRDIVNNLTLIPKSIEIRINIVLDENVYGLEELLDELEEKKISATFSLNPKEPWELSYQEKADLIVKYAKILKKRGLFQYSKLAGTDGDICDAKDTSYFVIDGQGNVYECNGEFRLIGHIGDQITRKIYTYKEECEDCVYLPACYGDCPYHEKCPKEYFDYLTPRLLKIYLSYE